MKVLHEVLHIFFYCFFHFLCAGQQIQAVVADRTTRLPVGDVFVFLANSSIGTASEQNGQFTLELSETKEIVIVFSHINYELLTLEVADANYLRDTFFIRPIEVELAEAVVVERSRPRLRARRLKAFNKAFLGEAVNEKLVKIRNQEVLLFDQKKDKLVASANEPLIIENRELGYVIQFYLEAFELYHNDDLLYKGNTFFEPITATPEQEMAFRKSRLDIYRKSSRSFFSDLVGQQLDTTTYLMGFSRLNPDREFVDFKSVSPSDLILKAKEEGSAYEIIIENFLTVVNQNILQQEPTNQAPQGPSLNQRIKNYNPSEPEYATSYLRSKSNRIVVNKYGKILNPSDIEEYGYWTSLRVSALLPSDYAPAEN